MPSSVIVKQQQEPRGLLGVVVGQRLRPDIRLPPMAFVAKQPTHCTRYRQQVRFLGRVIAAHRSRNRRRPSATCR